MLLIAQIALGVIVGGLPIAFLATSFFIWNGRQKNERLAFGLFIGGLFIVMVLLAVVARTYLKIARRSRSAINVG